MKNRNAAAVITVRDSNVFGAKAIYTETVDRKMAAPPSIAVGFLCHLSALGFATKLKRRAKARTAKVRMIVTTKLTIISAIGFAITLFIYYRRIFSPRSSKISIQLLYVRYKSLLAVMFFNKIPPRVSHFLPQLFVFRQTQHRRQIRFRRPRLDADPT